VFLRLFRQEGIRGPLIFNCIDQRNQLFYWVAEGINLISHLGYDPHTLVMTAVDHIVVVDITYPLPESVIVGDWCMADNDWSFLG